MPQSPLLKCRGLYTFANKLSEIPEGSLVEAENIVIDRDGVIEPRRGVKTYGDSIGAGVTDVAHQLLVYKGRVLRHWGASAGSTLEFDSDGAGAYDAFSGTFAEVEAGTRIKGLESNGNFYFTTSTGIKKISAAAASEFSTASGYVTDSGGIKALDTTVKLDFSQTGFFEQESVIAYRVVWGIKDPNNNLILGSPSASATIANPILDLLIRDYNQLLVSLDDAAGVDTADLDNTDHLSTLKTTVGSSASVLRTNLLALGDKLDADLYTEVAPATALTTTQATLASNVATVTFNAAVTSVFSVGETVKISGLTGAIADLNGTHVLTDVTGSEFSFAFTHANMALTADTGGTVIKKIYRLEDPETLSIIPTTAEMESLQAFFDNIVDNLILEDTTNISAVAQSAGNFVNSTTSCITNVTFTIPSGITTTHFYQIYRTGLTTSEGVSSLDDAGDGNPMEPGDEMGLVFEGNPTADEIAAGSITYQDITPESFRGADLYTNPNQEGILQANETPPLAKDIALFKGSTFFANTKTRHRKQIALLGVTKLVANTSTLSIKNGSQTDTYTFVAPAAEQFTIDTVADVADSLNGTYFTFNTANNETQYYAWYKTSGGAVSDPAIAGKTGIRIDIATGDSANTVATKTYNELNALSEFYIIVAGNQLTIENRENGITTDAAANTSGFTVTNTQQGAGEDAATYKVVISDAETFAQAADETARSLVRVINKRASGLVYAYYLSGPTDVPGLILLESRSLADVFFYLNVNDDATTGEQFNPMLPETGTTEKSDNEVAPNRVYYSKYQQPEAVPLLNYFDVGPKDKKVLRILGLRDSLFVLKEDAVYRISGEGTTSFSVSLFDSSTSLVAPDTAAVLNNQIYMFSDQGIATVSDTGVSVISRAIENSLRKLTSPNYTNFRTASWAVGYESDRAYLVWTVSETSDTKATQCFRYNTFTNTWTTSPTSKTCGVVNPVDTKLYLGAGDTNYVEIERKDFTRMDYADREYDLELNNGSVDETTLRISSTENTEIGDVLIQTQYLTVNQFNRMLQKLDADLKTSAFPTSFTNYHSTLAVEAGDDLRDAVGLLATKLDLDPGVAQNDFATTIAAYTDSFADTQTAFNAIMTKLNSDLSVVDTNYKTSTGTVTFEVRITDVDTVRNTIEVSYALNFVAGDIKLYKHIPTVITWAPQAMGDTTVLKQARESTVIFDNDSFSIAKVSYSTDLSPSFEEIDFDGSGTGVWSYGTAWGSDYWGGEGSGAPFRTYVPLEKQRCRYIQCKIEHNNAFEKFGILGNSYTFEQHSSKAYR